MKPVVTWVLVANARAAKVLENRGPGKGLTELRKVSFIADERARPRDRAGVGHSIAGPAVSAVDRVDEKHKVDARFAHTICDRLNKAFAAQEFDRLVLVTGPHMLGLLRDDIDKSLRRVLSGEIAKDLSGQPVDALIQHVGEVVAV